MKKIFALIAIIIAIATVTHFAACNNNKTEESQSGAKEDSMKAVIARGSYLANHVAGCMDCHSNRDFNKFSGPPTPGTEGQGGLAFTHELLEAVPGVVYASNITPDSATGIGTWSDNDILKALTRELIKTGIRFLQSCHLQILIIWQSRIC